MLNAMKFKFFILCNAIKIRNLTFIKGTSGEKGGKTPIWSKNKTCQRADVPSCRVVCPSSTMVYTKPPYLCMQPVQ